MPEIETQPAAEPAKAAEPTGMERFLGGVLEAANTPEPGAAPDPKPAAAAPTKPAEPAAKPAEKPAPAAAKPEAKPAPPEKKSSDAPELRKRLDELSGFEKKAKAEIEELKRHKAELEGRKFITPEVQREIDATKQELADARKRLSESDYRQSDDFKKQFGDPYKLHLKAMEDAAKEYGVVIDEEGKTRPGTRADLSQIANVPLAQRATVARKLFGDNAPAVLADMRELDRLENLANQALGAHQTNMEARTRQQREQWEAERGQYDQAHNASREELATKYPDYFGKSEDPEEQKALDDGYAMIDQLAQGGDKMTPQDRAAASAVVRAQAAGFRRMIVKHNRATALLKAANEELAKLRGTDPGRGGEGGAAATAAEDLSGGSAAMAEKFNNI